jgi:hypothetical protein
MTEVMGSTRDLLQLLNEEEDGIELASQAVNLLWRNGDAGKVRNVPHGSSVDRHGVLQVLPNPDSPAPERCRSNL